MNNFSKIAVTLLVSTAVGMSTSPAQATTTHITSVTTQKPAQNNSATPYGSVFGAMQGTPDKPAGLTQPLVDARSGLSNTIPTLAPGTPAVKVGDVVKAQNFRYSTFPLICKNGASCVLKPVTTFTVTKVSGNKFHLDGFAGYKDYKLYNSDGKYIGINKGSNGGKTYGEVVPELQYSMSGKNTTTTSTTSSPAPKPEKKTNPHNKYITSVEKKWDGEQNIWVIQTKPQAELNFFQSLLSFFFGISFGNENSRAINENKYYEEAVSLGLPRSETLRQQLNCHARGSAVKPTNWDLEEKRPALKNELKQRNFGCNVDYSYHGELLAN